VERIGADWELLDALRSDPFPAKIRMLQRQHDAAHRRYLVAIKTLATVRKLLSPSGLPVEIETNDGDSSTRAA
jgi:hypothetical protein